MPTTNPVPSQDPSDLLFNAGKLDEVLNGAGTSFTDRLGTARRTVAGMNADFDAQLADAESDLNVYRADAAASAAQALGYLNTIRTTSYGAYASDPATDPLGNPPNVGDEYFNTTSNLLKRFNGTTWQASDIDTANLAAPTGASFVGYTQAGTGAVSTNVERKLREFVSPEDFGAVGGGVDNTSAIQKALDTGKNVIGNGNYLISDSLYLNTDDQSFVFKQITMSAALGKAAILVGASDAAGTPAPVPRMRVTVRGKITGTGAKAAGSSGVGLVKCTTSEIGVRAWGFYAGIDVRGVSVINYFPNVDLRYNTYGLYDPSTNFSLSDIQASQFFGGRIEANEKEGVHIGSPNVKFIGTTIEGNGAVSNGGNGTDPEVRIIAGSTAGSVHFIDCYMETLAANTGDAMVVVESGASRFLHFIGGEYYGSGSTTRYVVRTYSTSTTQSYNFVGGSYYTVKNYVKGAVRNNSNVSVIGAYDDVSRDLTLDVTASDGAALTQYNRSASKQNIRHTANDFLSTSDTVGLAQFNFRQKTSRVAASAATDVQVIPASDITQGSIHVFEVVGVGRSSSTAGSSFCAIITVAGNVSAPGSILNTTVVSQYNNATLGFAINGSNGINATGLSSGVPYDFYVRRMVRA